MFPHFCRNFADQVCVSWRRESLSRGGVGDHHRMGSDAHAANDMSLILGRAGTLGGGGGSLWATLAADEQPVAELGWRR